MLHRSRRASLLWSFFVLSSRLPNFHVCSRLLVSGIQCRQSHIQELGLRCREIAVHHILWITLSCMAAILLRGSWLEATARSISFMHVLHSNAAPGRQRHQERLRRSLYEGTFSSSRSDRVMSALRIGNTSSLRSLSYLIQALHFSLSYRASGQPSSSHASPSSQFLSSHPSSSPPSFFPTPSSPTT